MGERRKILLVNVTPWLNWFWFGLKVLSKLLILRGKDKSNRDVFLLGLVAASLSLSLSFSYTCCLMYKLFLFFSHSYASCLLLSPLPFEYLCFSCVAHVLCLFTKYIPLNRSCYVELFFTSEPCLLFPMLADPPVLGLSHPHHPLSWSEYG